MLINAVERECDSRGCGHFGAQRGNRKHNGVDIACMKGSEVLAVWPGKVTKIGYPYDPSDKRKGHLRYVQVTDRGGRNFRYFYINPRVVVGDEVGIHGVLGVTQGLTDIYPGITDHFHFEVKYLGEYLDPGKVIDSLF